MDSQKPNPETDPGTAPEKDSEIRRQSDAAKTSELDIVDRGMAQWGQERPDINCSGKAIVGRILRLQDVIIRAVNSALKPHGLTYSTYAVLATLRVSGAPYRMSPSQLVDTLLLTSGGTSNLLTRLERKGWIRRLSDPQDGRAVIVELSPTGKALVDRAMTDHAAMERQLVNTFSPNERAVLAGLLSRMLVQNSSSARWIPMEPTSADHSP